MRHFVICSSDSILYGQDNGLSGLHLTAVNNA